MVIFRQSRCTHIPARRAVRFGRGCRSERGAASSFVIRLHAGTQTPLEAAPDCRSLSLMPHPSRRSRHASFVSAPFVIKLVYQHIRYSYSARFSGRVYARKFMIIYTHAAVCTNNYKHWNDMIKLSSACNEIGIYPHVLLKGD